MNRNGNSILHEGYDSLRRVVLGREFFLRKKDLKKPDWILSMEFQGTRSTFSARMVILLFFFVPLQWTNTASAFKSFASGEFYHKTLTHQGLQNISGVLKAPNPDKTIQFSNAAILAVQEAVRNVDSEDLFVAPGESELHDGQSHCDNEGLLVCSAQILKYRKELLETLTEQPLPQDAGPVAWRTLGKALHTVQDYYSHSNWVERGNTQTNNFLFGDSGKAGGLLPPTELPPKPNANVAPACQPASPGSQILNLADYPTSGFSLRGNICDVSTAHPGRCVHGCTGPLCEQTPDSTCAGINKDTPDELGGHAQGRHQIAANLAIQATTEFVTQIIGELQSLQGIDQSQKDEALCALLGSYSCAPVLPIIPGLIGPGVGTPAGSGPNRVGGKIIHVTTLAASGPGSFKEAVETSGPRIIVFDVSGYIELQKRIFVREPYVTIAGQTAPFPGISLKGSGIQIETHDVLVQHVRVRPGDDPNGSKPESRDAFTITTFGTDSNNTPYNVVIDHVSASWAIDENMSTWNFTDKTVIRDVTITNSIISEGLWDSIHPKGRHSMGFLVGPDTESLLVADNLFAHNQKRNMAVHGRTSTLFVNNVIYNWHGPDGTASHYGSDRGPLDASVVGNVYIEGLDGHARPEPILMRKTIFAASRLFIDDNEAISNTNDPWSDVYGENGIKINHLKADVSPNWIPGLIAQKSNVVKNRVLNNAGARRADGNPVDLRVLNDVKNGTGRIIDSQDEVGGWPALAKNVRGSGSIPELDIPSNPDQIQSSGYTKVEEWLHRLAEQVEVPR